MAQETMMTEAETITEGAASEQAVGNPADQVGEQQAAEQQQGEVQQTEAKPEEKVPEQYEDFTFQDGQELDAEIAEDIKAEAKALGLTQSEAQKLANVALKHKQAASAQQAVALEKARNEWAEASKADQEFGGDTFEANMAVARKSVESFASPELKQLLNESGLGNHPEFIRFCFRAGKAISEDRVIRGGATGQPEDPAKRLFPNQA